MSDDVGLQRAIMASLNSAASRPAPAPRLSNNHNATSFRGGPSRDIQPTLPRRTSSQRVSGTLAREGIKPREKREASPFSQQRPAFGRPKTGSEGGTEGGEVQDWRLSDRSMHKEDSTGDQHPQASQQQSQFRPATNYTTAPGRSPAGKPPTSRSEAQHDVQPQPQQPRRQATSNKPAVPKQGGGSGKDQITKAKENRDQFEALIEDEILDKSPNVQWEDIASLEEPKRLLNEAVVLPMLMPSFFTGIRSPWKGVLLYGPPGTGKTMLAKAVATTGKTTFFNMSSSSLLSRYHGESEKMVRALFNKARELAPSTIFFDEIDALVSSRGDAEHEVTRRVKTELLMQIDGISSVGDKRVMLLATTNRPWDIDEAMRRRLEKRIYVPLPDAEARLALFKLYTKTLKFASPSTKARTPTPSPPESPVEGGDENEDEAEPKNNKKMKQRLTGAGVRKPTHEDGLQELVHQTSGYSGADIQIMCRDAAMMPLRRAIMGMSPAELAAKSAELEASQHEMEVDLQLDFLGSAVKNVKPSVSGKDLQRYEEWTADFSSV